MTPNKKKAAGGFGTHVAASKTTPWHPSQHQGDNRVAGPLRRVLPVAVAGWLIQRGGCGMSDAFNNFGARWLDAALSPRLTCWLMG